MKCMYERTPIGGCHKNRMILSHYRLNLFEVFAHKKPWDVFIKTSPSKKRVCLPTSLKTLGRFFVYYSNKRSTKNLLGIYQKSYT